jgi:hypothetical protein
MKPKKLSPSPPLCLAITLALSVSGMAEEMKPLKIFVLTGQSNSLGTTGDKNEPDITPGRDPLDAEIRFFWANCDTRKGGDGRAQLYDDSGGKIVPLQAQKGSGADPLFWGPEIGFCRHLAAAGERDFLFVKASRGGGGNGYWLKSNSDNHMYVHVVDTVKRAIAALPAGTRYEVAALLYLQGESDNADMAEVAGERLKTLVANLRADLPNATGMRTIIAGIASGGPISDTVRARQSALPAADASFRYIDTMDLRAQRYDGLHFSKGAKLEIGKRMAKTWMDWK